MRPRGLQLEAVDELGVDDAFGDVTISFGGLGGLGASPLSLLSPNSAPLHRRTSPARTAKAAAGTAAAAASTAAAAAPASSTLPEENDPLGELPQFGQRGGGNGGTARRRPDARRQSLAIGAMFAGLTEHAEGLLGDSELAVGDEEVQVPLAKSGKLLGGAANHSSLFVDPNTADLLATQLPSPQLLSPGPLAGGGAEADAQATPTPPPRHLAAAAEQAAAEQAAAQQPAECDSPRIAPALRAIAASARKTPGGAHCHAGCALPFVAALSHPPGNQHAFFAASPPPDLLHKAAAAVLAGMRESVAVFSDLTRACESMGLDDYDGDDFQLQVSAAWCGWRVLSGSRAGTASDSLSDRSRHCMMS